MGRKLAAHVVPPNFPHVRTASRNKRDTALEHPAHSPLSGARYRRVPVAPLQRPLAGLRAMPQFGPVLPAFLADMAWLLCHCRLALCAWPTLRPPSLMLCCRARKRNLPDHLPRLSRYRFSAAPALCHRSFRVLIRSSIWTYGFVDNLVNGQYFHYSQAPFRLSSRGNGCVIGKSGLFWRPKSANRDDPHNSRRSGRLHHSMLHAIFTIFVPHLASFVSGERGAAPDRCRRDGTGGIWRSALRSAPFPSRHHVSPALPWHRPNRSDKIGTSAVSRER